MKTKIRRAPEIELMLVFGKPGNLVFEKIDTGQMIPELGEGGFPNGGIVDDDKLSHGELRGNYSGESRPAREQFSVTAQITQADVRVRSAEGTVR